MPTNLLHHSSQNRIQKTSRNMAARKGPRLNVPSYTGVEPSDEPANSKQCFPPQDHHPDQVNANDFRRVRCSKKNKPKEYPQQPETKTVAKHAMSEVCLLPRPSYSRGRAYKAQSQHKQTLYEKPLFQKRSQYCGQNSRSSQRTAVRLTLHFIYLTYIIHISYVLYITYIFYTVFYTIFSRSTSTSTPSSSLSPSSSSPTSVSPTLSTPPTHFPSTSSI